MRPLSKYPQRPVTTCEPCRRLKRKCDYRTIENGPCSNCVMRKIEEQCVLPNQSKSRNNDIVNTPVSTPKLATSIRFPVKFFTSCITRFFQTPELSFFIDQDNAIHSVIEYATNQSDLISISTLYAISAVILLRKGATVSAEFGFEGNRFQLCEELFNSHLSIYEKTEYSLEKSHHLLEALILRGNYYVDTERHNEALDTFRNAIGIYVDATTYTEESTSSTLHPTRIKRQLTLDKLYLGLCTLEASLTNETSDQAVLCSHREGKLKYADFTFERRWKVLCLSRKVSLLLSTYDSTRNNSEMNDVEHELISCINYIDTVEGQLHPYGQLELYIFLIKLTTRKIILQSEANQINSHQTETLQQLLDKAAHYSTEFAIRLETFISLGRQSPYNVSCMGSAPYLASSVFQGLTCIWMLSIFTKRLFIIEPNIENITQRIWSTLETVRSDSKICKHTSTLFEGLDLLNKETNSNGYDIKIPTELHNGIVPLAKQWNNENWLNFQPTYNDKLLWSYLFTKDFDLTLPAIDDEYSPEDLILLN